MKKLLVLILLVIIFKLPMSAWMEASQDEKKGLAQLAWDLYSYTINPSCAEGKVTALDAGDGWILLDATCDKEFPKKDPKIPEVDPDKIIGRLK